LLGVVVGRVMRDATMDYPFAGLQRVNIAIAPQSFTLLRFVMLQLIKIAPTEETVRCGQRMPLFFYC